MDDLILLLLSLLGFLGYLVVAGAALGFLARRRARR
jgi:hypothetical protein